MAIAIITRTELYRRVWSEPMSRLAREFGLSDVGMAKICRKHDIPRPPRGYWAKKRVGKAPRQIPLPNAESDPNIPVPDPIEFPSPTADEAGQDRSDPTLERNRPRIKVKKSLRGAHPLVVQMRDQLQRAERDDCGLLIRPADAVLDIRVSKANLRRSLMIMDAVLKALQGLGYDVARGPNVRILDVRVGFGISEQLQTIKQEADDEELDGYYKFRHSRFQSSRSPTGRLVVRINETERYWARGCRQTFRDGKKLLEDRLIDVVVGLEEMAARIKQHQLAEEQRDQERRDAEKRRQEEAQRRAKLRARAKAELARVDALLQQARNWTQSEDVRRFIEATRQCHLAQHSTIEAGSDIAQWLDWADQQADRLDPLTESPPSILDEDLGNDEHEQPRFRPSW